MQRLSLGDRLRREEEGLSLTEVMTASALIAIVTASFFTIFTGFMTNVRDEELKTRAQDEGRIATSQIIVDLRQAYDLTGDEEPVVELKALTQGDTTDSIEFHSDRLAFADGPEKYLFELRNCVGQLCELWQAVTYAAAPATPPYVYPATPDRETLLLRNVVADGTPVFRGTSWATGVETHIDACDGTIGNRCSFNLVDVILRIDPDPDGDGPRIVQFQEQVRMRNA